MGSKHIDICIVCYCRGRWIVMTIVQKYFNHWITKVHVEIVPHASHFTFHLFVLLSYSFSCALVMFESILCISDYWDIKIEDV
ncbi:hypothetical protein RchiOBHm_Chr2g0158551 [Rosa chinensis]|uniref:Uncharacterized protein n=1 Tax=Rosa chinensis TaxID=74649 RepID=A0A2P6S218_ROSCH|nr:hypothetical protein RchiOBHm_Chr2g0158551 [Rosa chinensis]